MIKKVSVRIRCERRSGVVVMLAVAVLVAVFLGYLVLRPREATAAGPQALAASVASQVASSGLRQYYVTPTYRQGGNAKNACAAGYHMASLWEILDPSNLRYNSALGATRGDSGSGPPSNYLGWVRTGYANNTTGSAGQANCNGWSSSSGSANGTFVYLPYLWTASHTIHVWEASVAACSASFPVWCVADTVGVGTCADPLAISDGQQADGDTSTYSNNISAYDCSPWSESGPETLYAFTLPAGDFYTVTAALSNHGSVDLDVFLLSSTGCGNPGQCLAIDSFGNETAVAAPVLPGTYYIAVDGFNGVSSTYSIELTVESGAGERVYTPLVLRNFQ